MNRTVFGILVIVAAASGCSAEDTVAGVPSSDAQEAGAPPKDPPRVEPSSSKVRVAHLSPDAPPIDFCFKAVDGSVVGPVLEQAGLLQGVAFGQVTPYISSTEGTYTVQVIGADASGCDAALVEVPNVVVPGGGLEITTAAIGLTQAADPAFELIFLLDENLPVEGKAKVRFLHAAPGVESVDVGVLPNETEALSGEEILFDKVSYKNTEQPPYATVDPLVGATLRAQFTSDGSAGVEALAVDLEAGQVATVFAIGVGEDLEILVCLDSEGDGACGLR